MKQTTNALPRAATDEPAPPATDRPRCRESRLGDHLDQLLAQAAAAAAVADDPPPDRAGRRDGWNAESMRLFLTRLAGCGVVAEAARAAGKTRQGAYAFRNSARGRAFDLAWRAAELLARQRLSDDVLSRAVHGCVEVYIREGVVTERHRYDNRLSMAVLARLDHLAAASDPLGGPVRYAAEEFDRFLDIVCAGGAGAAEFVETRLDLGPEGHQEPRVLGRAETYRKYGVGLPEEIDISDLDPADMAHWTDEQADRALRSGFLMAIEGREEAQEEGQGPARPLYPAAPEAPAGL
ncbi:hypothetical protein [Sphingosinicella sp. CPCC 101087]|uniref:hypothetical protein n=1 Tax=Sphingosinicella sp. CPCC 101087 TaxID=2497754 RepID=UPI00101D4FD8|nr:hypothetical protein [Sphingosinicella sp. CPCC 101087]